MKLSFGFDEDNRQFLLIPKDPLEELFLSQIADFCSRGATLKLFKTPDEVSTFKMEFNLNGASASIKSKVSSEKSYKIADGSTSFS